MSWLSGAENIPGGGCDANPSKSLKDLSTHMNLAELPPGLMDRLLDSTIPMSIRPLVSQLMFNAYNHGYEEGRQAGMEDVLEDPASYFHPQEDEL